MHHDHDDTNGTLVMNSREYHESRSTIVRLRMNVAQRSPVKHVVTWICDLEMKDYTFTGGGMSCRHWLCVTKRWIY